MENNTDYIAYLILQNEYLKQNGLQNLTNEQLLLVFPKYFPNNWQLEYSLDEKIRFISQAIKSKTNLHNIIDNLET